MFANRATVAHAIASAPDQGPPSQPVRETWYVATSSGTRAMTLDELDEALARGEVDASTRLWIPGMAEWEPLASVANLEDGSPLECTPGAMLEYGLDAERASQNEDGSARPSSDIRDYDPFAFPPPANDIPDPNEALWASILPPLPEHVHTRVRLPAEPWWRAEGRMPWIGLMLSGSFVFCMSLLGVARILFDVPAEVQLQAETLALEALPARQVLPVAREPLPLAAEPLPLAAEPLLLAAEPLGAPAPAEPGPDAPPTWVRYDEPESAPRALAPSRPRAEERASKRKPAPRAAVKKRAAHALARR